MNAKSTVNAEDQDQASKNNYLNFKGANVLWPADCPDDMLEKAIEFAHINRRMYPPDTQGATVTYA